MRNVYPLESGRIDEALEVGQGGAQQRAESLCRKLAGPEDFGVGRNARRICRRVDVGICDQGNPQHAQSRVTRRNDFGDRGHPDGIGAEAAEHLHLGAGFEVRSLHTRINAFLERDSLAQGGAAEERGRHRTKWIGHIGESWADPVIVRPSERIAKLKINLIADEHEIAGEEPAREAARGVGHDEEPDAKPGEQPGRERRFLGIDGLVEVPAPREKMDRNARDGANDPARRMTRDAASREPWDFGVRNGNRARGFAGESAEARTENKSDARAQTGLIDQRFNRRPCILAVERLRVDFHRLQSPRASFNHNENPLQDRKAVLAYGAERLQAPQPTVESAILPAKTRHKAKTYTGAGVSIEAGDKLVDYLRRANPAIGGFSGFGALPPGMKRPRLVMSTDGVGTKLLVAQLAGIHGSIGIDLVGMVVNDLLTCGARPLYFLDYFATGHLEQGVAREVLRGIIRACKETDCDLVGGETAEMPGMYGAGHYDLAGFGVGAVDEADIVDGRRVRAGDLILGLASNGLHSNGFSLVRRVLLPKGDAAARRALARPFGKGTLAKELLRPTRLYVRTVVELLKHHKISAMAHITGGGIEGNLVRVLPSGTRACIRLGSWPIPPIFTEIHRKGPVDLEEMLRVFNLGIGYILVVRPSEAREVLTRLKKLRQEAWPIGWIGRTKKGTPASTLIISEERPAEKIFLRR